MIKLTDTQQKRIEKYWDRKALVNLLEGNNPHRVSHNINTVIKLDLVEFLKCSEDLGLLKKNISVLEECRNIQLKKLLKNKKGSKKNL